jgi:hypothetical protein
VASGVDGRGYEYPNVLCYYLLIIDDLNIMIIVQKVIR